MTFKINLVFEGSTKQGPWILNPSKNVVVLTKPGDLQLTMLPDVESKEESYTLILAENGFVPKFPKIKAEDKDYQFAIAHLDQNLKLDASLLGEPHTMKLHVTSDHLTVAVNVLAADEGSPIKNRAYLSLVDTKGSSRGTTT